MTILDAILATVAADTDARDGLTGRTLLQKKLYFLSVLSAEDFGFAPHYYGPYSSQVSDELSALVSAGFVAEDATTLPNWDGRFAERRRYHYRVTDAFREIAGERQCEMERYRPHLERINAHPVAQNIELISVAAKVYLILSRKGETTTVGIKEEAKELGWDLNETKIEAVSDYLERLKLVTRYGAACA